MYAVLSTPNDSQLVAEIRAVDVARGMTLGESYEEYNQYHPWGGSFKLGFQEGGSGPVDYSDKKKKVEFKF